MERATKTKIIAIGGFLLFVLVMLAVAVPFLTKDKEDKGPDLINTSLRAQQSSDFTIDDMMKANEGRPEYAKNTAPSDEEEVKRLQQQLRNNINKQGSRPEVVTKSAENTEDSLQSAPANPVPVSRFFGQEESNTGNTIEAIVSGDQDITDGSVLKLVTVQELKLDDGTILQKGTALFGKVALADDRIKVTIESVRLGNSILSVNRTVYDQDSYEGIYVPLNMLAEAGKEVAEEAVQNLNIRSTTGGLLTDGVNAVSSAAKNIFRKKNNQIVITVKSNYKVYLK